MWNCFFFNPLRLVSSSSSSSSSYSQALSPVAMNTDTHPCHFQLFHCKNSNSYFLFPSILLVTFCFFFYWKFALCPPWHTALFFSLRLETATFTCIWHSDQTHKHSNTSILFVTSFKGRYIELKARFNPHVSEKYRHRFTKEYCSSSTLLLSSPSSFG